MRLLQHYQAADTVLETERIWMPGNVIIIGDIYCDLSKISDTFIKNTV